jgi:hypothetical protein
MLLLRRRQNRVHLMAASRLTEAARQQLTMAAG